MHLLISVVMTHIQVVNPNTSAATTALMVDMARSVLPENASISGITARTGSPLIVDPTALAAAADAVLALQHDLTGDAIIIAGFGDPGADELRRRMTVPVVGIGEASICAAAERGRRFSIVTTTPQLEPAIRARVDQLGFASLLASIRITASDPIQLTGDAAALEAALEALVARCSASDGAEAVIIGGGPLSQAARAIAGRSPVSIIEPLPEAVRLALRQLSVCA